MKKPIDQDDGRNPASFNLVRYYTLASLSVMVAVGLIAFALISFWVKEAYLRTEKDVADNLIEEIVVSLRSTGFTPDVWKTQPPPKTNPVIQRLLKNFGITHFELYTPDGTSVVRFNSQEGKRPPIRKEGWQKALKGRVVSYWSPASSGDLTSGQSREGWVGTYAPIRLNGQIVGVAYLRRDWGKVLATEHHAWSSVAITAVASGGLILLTLWLVVRRADRLIHKQQEEIRVANQQLEALVEKLEATNDSLARLGLQKDHFLAVCSHDIRSPLIGVVAGCRVVLKEKIGRLNAKQREVIEANLLSAQNVMEMTASLLDLARIENGAEQLVREWFDLGLLVRQSCESHRLAATTKQVHLRISLPIDPILLQADRLKVLRICNNLISNAIKYTAPSTEVCVEVSTRNRNVLLQVTDRGPGIGEEDRKLIFDRFSPLARSKRTRLEGTGLGLAITKELVLLHQGQITVESELGKGSTFCVQFPWHQPSDSNHASSQRPEPNASTPLKARAAPPADC